jgi:hypothetical protein
MGRPSPPSQTAAAGSLRANILETLRALKLASRRVGRRGGRRFT